MAGAMHFVRPRYYVSIMPDWLPAHRGLVAASGAAEIAGGVGLMLPAPRARRWAARWLIATVAAVFPANVHMAQHPERYPRVPGGRVTLYLRLPAQLLFVWWIVAAGRRRPAAG
jgi:uncharacterized membrane protein